MPFLHTESFRIRHYECDIYGHVNNAIYLRYIQETGLGFLAAAGLRESRLPDRGWSGWTPFIDIEYLLPLFYGETVEVTARPLGVQGTFFRQGYEFRKAGSGELSARANTATVFINPQDRQEAAVPPDLIAACFPEGLPAPAISSETLPPAPPAPPGIFRTRCCVAWQDGNAAGQVDPATLLAYIEDCGRQVVAAHGWPMERMLADGFAILLRRNQIEYRLPARIGEELELATWASNARRVTATRHYIVTRLVDGEILGRVHALGVWVNLETGQPIRIPPDLLADFAANIVA